eukprot:gene22280-26879_t
MTAGVDTDRVFLVLSQQPALARRGSTWASLGAFGFEHGNAGSQAAWSTSDVVYQLSLDKNYDSLIPGSATNRYQATRSMTNQFQEGDVVTVDAACFGEEWCAQTFPVTGAYKRLMGTVLQCKLVRNKKRVRQNLTVRFEYETDKGEKVVEDDDCSNIIDKLYLVRKNSSAAEVLTPEIEQEYLLEGQTQVGSAYFAGARPDGVALAPQQEEDASSLGQSSRMHVA